MMPRSLFALLVAVGLLAPPGFAPASAQGNTANRQAATGGLKDKFVGTWTLVSVEQRNAKGEVIPAAANAAQNRTGYIIIYDPAGFRPVLRSPVRRLRRPRPVRIGRRRTQQPEPAAALLSLHRQPPVAAAARDPQR